MLDEIADGIMRGTLVLCAQCRRRVTRAGIRGVSGIDAFAEGEDFLQPTQTVAEGLVEHGVELRVGAMDGRAGSRQEMLAVGFHDVGEDLARFVSWSIKQ